MLAALALAACGQSSEQEARGDGGGSSLVRDAEAKGAAPARWYNFSQVSRGARVYAENCAQCHGESAQGAPNWRQRGPEGMFPPPPLNGSGHGWHHPLNMLFYVVKNGSPGGKGNMPAWKGRLSDEEILAAIAWFQSRWSDRVYAEWQRIDRRARRRNGAG